MSWPYCLLFPSCCCFHCLFSHSQTVSRLIPIIPSRDLEGQPGLHHTPNPTQSWSLQGRRWSSCSLMCVCVYMLPSQDLNPFLSHSEKARAKALPDILPPQQEEKYRCLQYIGGQEYGFSVSVLTNH